MLYLKLFCCVADIHFINKPALPAVFYGFWMGSTFNENKNKKKQKQLNCIQEIDSKDATTCGLDRFHGDTSVEIPDRSRSFGLSSLRNNQPAALRQHRLQSESLDKLSV